MRFFSFGADRQVMMDDALAIAEFVRTKDVGIQDVLGSLAKRFGAIGAVLWQLAGEELTDDMRFDRLERSEHWRLFTVGVFFDCPGPPYAMHNLPLFESRTGDAVRVQAPIIEADLQRNGGRFRNNAFLLRHGISQMLCVPIDSRDPEGKRRLQTLNVYRTRGQPGFNQTDAKRLQYSAQLINSVVDSMEDGRAVRILLEIDRVLLTETKPSSPDLALRNLPTLPFKECCEKLGSMLNCCEVSLFLSHQKDDDQFPDEFTSLASRPAEPGPVVPGKGLTGWVLQHKKGIRILDLAKFEEDQDQIHREYPRAEWTDHWKVRSFAKEKLGFKEDSELPPLSFMAAPVMADNKRFGVIRCSVRRSGPSYFSDRDLRMLTAVATRLGLTWQDALLKGELYAERGAWKLLGQAIEPLNAKLQSNNERPRRACIQEVLDAIPNILPQVDIVDVREPAGEGKSLKVSAAAGPRWDSLPQADRDKAIEYSFPLGEPWACDGAEVYETGQIKHVREPRLGLLPAKEIVMLPISSGTEKYGVLDLHRCGDVPLPRTTIAAAQILSSQLGLYLRMLDVFQKERKALEEPQAWVVERDRTYQDLSHQLKTPLLTLAERASQAVELTRAGLLREEALVRIRGLARKCWNVAQSMQLLADLNSGRPITLSRDPVTASGVRQMLIELASDAEALLAPSSNIRFEVDKTWLFDETGFKNIRVQLDWNLLRQCVSNLLDNAGKYSKRNTTVRIVTGISWKGLEIQVENRGIRIKDSEIEDAKKRDWRGQKAKAITGEGRGIGLWIVDQVMKLHAGQLNILPTNADGVTVNSLVFPPTPILYEA